MSTEIHAALASLAAEEAQVQHSKAESIRQARKQAERDLERAAESLRRALPELDVVSRTCADLRGAIRKTMDRADLVSDRVRELDLARSRALAALDRSTRHSEVRQSLVGAERALQERDLQLAAEYVRRFDEANSGDASLMAPLRAELERLVGERLDGMWDGLREAAAQDDWLECAVARNALEHASVMSKLGPASTLALGRYASFVVSLFKERCEYELLPVRAVVDDRPPAADSPLFLNGIKCVLNAAAAVVDKHSPHSRAAQGLGTGVAHRVLAAVHGECDAQMQALFDQYMSARRLHERAGAPTDVDLSALNACLIEVCLMMQRVESYERFIRARCEQWGAPPQAGGEIRRLMQELAGVYTLLEKGWIAESMARAQRAEEVRPAGELQLLTSSVVEDDFYVARAAVKRALATGLCDAASGCVNIAVGALEDALLAGAFRPGHHQGGAQLQAKPSAHVQVNSLEQACEFCVQMHRFVTSSDALERAEDKAKLRSCADGLLDVRSKFEALREDALAALFNVHVRPGMKQSLADVEGLNFLVDEQAFERDDGFASRFVATAGTLLDRHRGLLSPRATDTLIELAAQAAAEEVERGVVVKRFTQLGALKLERDVRALSAGLSGMASNPLPVRAMFARLLQITALLSVGAVEEAHDAWDARETQRPGGRAREGLSAKEAKRVLGLRQDFDVKAIQHLKL